MMVLSYPYNYQHIFAVQCRQIRPFSSRSLAIKLSWKSHQMTPFFVKKEVLEEKIIILMNYGNIYKSEKKKGQQSPHLYHFKRPTKETLTMCNMMIRFSATHYFWKTRFNLKTFGTIISLWKGQISTNIDNEFMAKVIKLSLIEISMTK